MQIIISITLLSTNIEPKLTNRYTQAQQTHTRTVRLCVEREEEFDCSSKMPIYSVDGNEEEEKTQTNRM